MTDKEQKLKPRLISCVSRLQRLIDLNAPGVIIGHEALQVYVTALAVYGESAGSALISHLRDQSLHDRGVCSHKDCVSYVELPGVGICEPCQKEMGIDDASLDELEKEVEKDGMSS